MVLRYLIALILAPLFLSLFAALGSTHTLHNGPVAARAEPDPAPAPSPFFGVGFPSKALLGRAREPAVPTSPPVYSPEPTQEFEVDILPFVLVSSIDGALHAMDRETGEIRWSLRDGVEPLVGGKVYGEHEDLEYIVEPLSGSLYVFEEDTENPGNPKVRQLPYSVQYM
jgi:serine/threonine-protein kinase/endoribonuclease IRE1